MITAVVFLAAATGSPQASVDPCNHVAQATTIATPSLPKALRSKFPDGVSVTVLVEVDDTGKVTGAGVWGTPPDPGLIGPAQSAVMKSTFTPAAFNCKPIGDRLFETIAFPAASQ
jgi:hypothetical protein